MFCQKCGARIPEDSTFCTSCGAKQIEVTPQPQGGDFYNTQKLEYSSGETTAIPKVNVPENNQPQYQGSYVQTQKKNHKTRNTIIGVGIVGGALIGIIVVLFMNFYKPTINLNDYIEIEYEGYDTVGTATVQFDDERFRDDYGEALSKKMSKGKKKAVEKFLDSNVEWKLSKTEDLKNGEEVQIIWKCKDERVKEKYDYVLKHENKKFKVSGLEEAEEVDLFEGMSVEFNGIAPKATASINDENISEIAEEMSLELNRDSGLSNGDTVTVTASYGEEDVRKYCLENYGKIPKTLTKDFKVSGVDTYVQSISDISQNAMNDMKKKATEYYTESKDGYDGESFQGMDYLGCYFLKNKSLDSYYAYNQVYLVYKIRYHEIDEFEGNNKNITYYWWIGFDGVTNDEKGVTHVDLTNESVPSYIYDDCVAHVGAFNVYETLEGVRQKIIVDNAEDYTHEEKMSNTSTQNQQNNQQNKNTQKNNNAQQKKTKNTKKKKQNSGKSGKKEKGIIFPNSSTKKLTKKQVSKLSNEQIQKAINEIYARNGYEFSNPKKRKYYEKYSWYHGTIKSQEKVKKKKCNSIEKANLKILEEERDRR